MVAPGRGVRVDTRSRVSQCHALPYDASAAVTDFGENYVQSRMETKKDLQRKLAQFSVQMRMETKLKKGLHHKSVEFSTGL